MRHLHIGILSLLILVPALAGCVASNAATDPGARPLPKGQSCAGIQQELRTLDRRGVPAHVERLSGGGNLTSAQRADATRYNELLDRYLGARCHV